MILLSGFWHYFNLKFCWKYILCKDAGIAAV